MKTQVVKQITTADTKTQAKKWQLRGIKSKQPAKKIAIRKMRRFDIYF